MTLEGANRALRGDRSQAPEGSGDAELLERLHSLRSMLIAVRDSLGEDSATEATAAPIQTAAAVESTTVASVAPESEHPKPVYKEQTLFDF